MFANTLQEIRGTTETLIRKTKDISSHAALFFLSWYIIVPRSIFLMRAAPVYTATDRLTEIDNFLREATHRHPQV